MISDVKGGGLVVDDADVPASPMGCEPLTSVLIDWPFDESRVHRMVVTLVHHLFFFVISSFLNAHFSNFDQPYYCIQISDTMRTVTYLLHVVQQVCRCHGQILWLSLISLTTDGSCGFTSSLRKQIRFLSVS